MLSDIVIVVFCCKFCGVPSRDAQKELTITERVVVLRKIREQPPNTSHRQLAEITGVPKDNAGTDTARLRIIGSAA